MTTFAATAALEDEKTTRDLLKTALAKVSVNPTRFLYYEKFQLGAKVVPLVLVDFASNLQADVKAKFGKAPSATGRCHANKQDELVFEAESGSMKLDGLKTFLSNLGVKREVRTQGSGPPQAEVKPQARSMDGPAPRASQVSALAKQLTTFKVRLESLRPELRDAFELQLRKVATLVGKDEGAAGVLLGQLQTMLTKALGSAHPELDQANVEAVLAASAKQVDEAFGRLPTEPKTSLHEDVRGLPEYVQFDGYRKKPDSIPASAALRSVSKRLLERMEQKAALARAWPKVKEDADSRFKQAITKASAEVGKPNLPKLQTFRESKEFKQAKTIGESLDAYARREMFEQATAAALLKLSGLVQDIQAWDEAVRQARQQLQVAIGQLAAEVRDAVDGALKQSQQWKAFEQQLGLGAKQLLAAASLAPLGAALLDQLGVLQDLEQRRVRARKLLAALPAERQRLDAFVKRCTAAITKASAPLNAVEQSFLVGTQATELATDAATCTQARTPAEGSIQRIDQVLPALSAEPPPAAQALLDAEQLPGGALADIRVEEQRIKATLETLSPAGREQQIDQWLAAAKTDPARMLSKDRAGNIRNGLLALGRPQVEEAIAKEVHKQHHPTRKDWFKVFGLPNTSTQGNLRVGQLGTIAHKNKQVPLHLSIYMANVDLHPPGIASPVDDIMNALLPPAVGALGTHVTLEVYGQADHDNPRYFRGAAQGVANGLEGDTEWPDIETAMAQKLSAEMARLRALAQQHCTRMGKWSGE